LKTKSHACYVFNCIFLTRRLIYVWSLSGLITKTSAFNLMTHIIVSMGLLVYLLIVRPYEIPADNRIEIMNEFFILIFLYLTFILAVFELKPQVRSTLGFLMIGVVFLCIAINFLIFLKNMLAQLWAKVSIVIAKIKEAQRRKALKTPKEDIIEI
jgi:hypothetical protein